MVTLSMILSSVWVVCIALWSSSALAQDLLWSRVYAAEGNDYPWCFALTSDGGYIVAGVTYTSATGNADACLLRIGPTGDTTWFRTYGGSGSDRGVSVQRTADGGYILLASTSSFGEGSDDIYLIKTDSTGDTLWTRTYGGTGQDNGWSVQQTSDGGYLLTGRSSALGCVIKTDSNGDLTWNRRYIVLTLTDIMYGRQTTDNGYILAGYTTLDGYNDAFLIKTTATGDTLWSRTYGGSDNDWLRSVQQTTDGGYIAAGMTYSFGAGMYDMLLIKTDSNGDTLWVRTYGGDRDDAANCVQQTADGGYIVTGVTHSFTGGGQIWVVKTDSQGDTQWTRAFGDVKDDEGFHIQSVPEGGYLVVGMTKPFGSVYYDMMITRLDSSGNTCFGDFVSPTVMSVPCTVSSPPTSISVPSMIVGYPQTVMASPVIEVSTFCEETAVLCGDANDDGLVDLGDAVRLLNYLFKNGPAPVPHTCAGDTNNDDLIDLGDAVGLLNYLFKGGLPPDPDCCSPQWAAE